MDWDYFKFKIDDLQVQANQGGKWRGTNTFARPVVDFKSSFGPAGYSIATQGAPVVLDFESAFMGVSIGHALLNVGGFFQVEGSFAIQKQGGQTIDGQTGLPSVLTGAASGLTWPP